MNQTLTSNSPDRAFISWLGTNCTYRQPSPSGLPIQFVESMSETGRIAWMPPSPVTTTNPLRGCRWISIITCLDGSRCPKMMFGFSRPAWMSSKPVIYVVSSSWRMDTAIPMRASERGTVWLNRVCSLKHMWQRSSLVPVSQCLSHRNFPRTTSSFSQHTPLLGMGFTCLENDEDSPLVIRSLSFNHWFLRQWRRLFQRWGDEYSSRLLVQQ